MNNSFSGNVNKILVSQKSLMKNYTKTRQQAFKKKFLQILDTLIFICVQLCVHNYGVLNKPPLALTIHYIHVTSCMKIYRPQAHKNNNNSKSKESKQSHISSSCCLLSLLLKIFCPHVAYCRLELVLESRWYYSIQSH